MLFLKIHMNIGGLQISIICSWLYAIDSPKLSPHMYKRFWEHNKKTTNNPENTNYLLGTMLNVIQEKALQHKLNGNSSLKSHKRELRLTL
jgi:hypothetical protein